MHVDRVAGPWLICRFIDSTAEFSVVPRRQIDQVAQEAGVIPFDTLGVELGHQEGRVLVWASAPNVAAQRAIISALTEHRINHET